MGILSNIGDKWPGDPSYFPVFQELNRRKAVVFIHPFVPKCCRKLVSGVQDYVVEFDFDTTRAVTSLLYNGVLSRCPDIRLIVNHSGAAVPVLSGRIKDRVPGDESLDHRDAPREGKNANIPNGVMYELKRLYYECAHATYPISLGCAIEIAPARPYMFGTDYPPSDGEHSPGVGCRRASSRPSARDGTHERRTVVSAVQDLRRLSCAPRSRSHGSNL